MAALSRRVVGVLGTLAGLAGYVYLLGGAAVLVHALVAKLPHVQAAAAAPPQELFAIGIYNLMIWGVVVAVVMLAAAGAAYGVSRLPPLARRIIAVLAAIAAIVVAVSYTWTVGTLVAIATLAALVTVIGPASSDGILTTRKRRWDHAPRYIYGAIAFVAVPAVVWAVSKDDPDDYHRAVVHLQGGRCVSGAYVTRNQDEVVLGDATGRRLIRLTASAVDRVDLARQWEAAGPVRDVKCSTSPPRILIGSGNAGQTVQGPKGDKGDDGAKGNDGAKGDKGDRGTKGDAGARGKTGQRGLRGQDGRRGQEGRRGAQGPQGSGGRRGERGGRGETGRRGTEGPRGVRGPEGPRGRRGPPGFTG